MKHQFYRNRSEFWITVYENEDSYSISTNEKYINIINYAFPNLVASSPTKWRKSEKYDNMSNLWLPEGCYTQEVMKIFLEWCKDVTQNILWIHLNKNIENYFNNELDYCIASDFNIVYGVSRTEIGEAEYQLKYNIDNLSKKEQTQYADLIMHRMLDNCKHLPIYNTYKFFTTDENKQELDSGLSRKWIWLTILATIIYGVCAVINASRYCLITAVIMAVASLSYVILFFKIMRKKEI